jgi:D-alanyl-D-alanine carboxypeptidase
VDGVPSGDEITLDMLGRMRSGLVNYTEEDEFATGLFTESPAGPYAFAPSVPELLGLS